MCGKHGILGAFASPAKNPQACQMGYEPKNGVQKPPDLTIFFAGLRKALSIQCSPHIGVRLKLKYSILYPRCKSYIIKITFCFLFLSSDFVLRPSSPAMYPELVERAISIGSLVA